MIEDMFFFYFDKNSTESKFENASDAILSVVNCLMEGVMDNVLIKNPFDAYNISDSRLVFELAFLKQLFDDYKHIDLKIWRTFTDTTLKEVQSLR